MVAQTVVMGIVFYEKQVAACAFVCVGSHCLPTSVSARVRWLLCDYSCRGDCNVIEL